MKGHLLVEQHLYDLLRAKLEDPEALLKANLRFPQLALVAKSVSGSEAPDKLWAAIDALNTVRNRLAHKLDPHDVDWLASRFLSQLEKPEVAEGAGTRAQEVKYGIAYICGLLTALTERALKGSAT